MSEWKAKVWPDLGIEPDPNAGAASNAAIMAALTDLQADMTQVLANQATMDADLDLMLTDDYDAESTIEDWDAAYMYTAKALTDGSGYRAIRVDRVTEALTFFEAALPIPADIKTLAYA